MKRLITILLITLFVTSCGTNKRVVTKKNKNKTVRVVKQTETSKDTQQKPPKEESEKQSEVTVVDTPEVFANPTEEYIAIFSDIAQEEMRLYKIPASVTLAQGILESGSGKGRLSLEGNNHFGIKCHGWTGKKIYHDDDAAQECFRKYNNAKYSFRDHSLFLKERKRYANLFELEEDDYEGWAKELRKAGYATDRKYPQKLISIIERYQLYRFDAEVLGKESSNNDKHVVEKGDTLYSISRKYKLSVKELKSLNSLENDSLFVGQVLYVKPLPKDY